MSKEKQKRADGFEQIEEATISTEQFIEKNQKLLVRGVLVIIIVVGALLGYYRFYKAPMEQEALKQMFVAENLFEKDSFNMALNGDGNAPGLIVLSGITVWGRPIFWMPCTSCRCVKAISTCPMRRIYVTGRLFS